MHLMHDDCTVQQSLPPQQFTSQTAAGAISHQTSTGDASLTIHVHLQSPSRQIEIANDDALSDPYHDHLCGHQMKIAIAIVTYITEIGICTINLC